MAYPKKTLFLIVVIVWLAESVSSAVWRRLLTQQCLPNSSALQVMQVRSDTECAFASDAMSGLLVAQFESDTRQCSLFQFIAVCRLIDGFDAAEGGGDRAQLSCAAFVNARTANFITLSRKLMLGAGSKLRAAWVMSDDAEASRSNLVCGQTQQWMTEEVEWSSEGAKFDGVSSKMWLDNVEFANLKQGLTWLVRLKRVPKEAPLLEARTCDTKAPKIAFWDGTPATRGLYFFRFSSNWTSFRTDKSTNTFDPSAYAELGVTSASPDPSDRIFYSNQGFVPQSLVIEENAWTIEPPLNFSCFSLGFRSDDLRMLEGTVQAVAIMNDTMTEAEIGSFFGLVR